MRRASSCDGRALRMSSKVVRDASENFTTTLSHPSGRTMAFIQELSTFL